MSDSTMSNIENLNFMDSGLTGRDHFKMVSLKRMHLINIHEKYY